MKGVQCYELFGGIALKIHTFSFFSFFQSKFWGVYIDSRINWKYHIDSYPKVFQFFIKPVLFWIHIIYI